MVEYALLLSLIGLIAMSSIQVVGTQSEQAFTALGAAMAGGSGDGSGVGGFGGGGGGGGGGAAVFVPPPQPASAAVKASRAARRYVVFVVCMVFRGLLGVRLL